MRDGIFAGAVNAQQGTRHNSPPHLLPRSHHQPRLARCPAPAAAAAAAAAGAVEASAIAATPPRLPRPPALLRPRVRRRLAANRRNLDRLPRAVCTHACVQALDWCSIAFAPLGARVRCPWLPAPCQPPHPSQTPSCAPPVRRPCAPHVHPPVRIRGTLGRQRCGRWPLHPPNPHAPPHTPAPPATPTRTGLLERQREHVVVLHLRRG